jgi:hypothetical protein
MSLLSSAMLALLAAFNNVSVVGGCGVVRPDRAAEG